MALLWWRVHTDDVSGRNDTPWLVAVETQAARVLALARAGDLLLALWDRFGEADAELDVRGDANVAQSMITDWPT